MSALRRVGSDGGSQRRRLRTSDFGLRSSPAFRPPRSAFRVSAAFSLVEILIVVALMSVIVLGLMAMFGQTQRAFRAGLAQTDVLEAGRAATDLLARELAQIRPSDVGAVNFYAEIGLLPTSEPLYQDLPGTADRRTNILGDLFFLTYENQRWTAVGYRVGPPDNGVNPLDSGVGTLYRFVATNLLPVDLPRQLADFNNTPPARLSRIADGVVHLRVRAFDPDGEWIAGNLTNNFNFNKSDVRWPNGLGALVPGEIGYYAFKSNAVPAAVEIELGFLETRTLERAMAIPDNVARRNYLSNHVGQVHLFRQRIPISTVDVQAYQ